MKKFGFLLAILLIFCVSDSSAQGFTLAGLIGSGSEDGYNFGFGGRAGVTLPGSGLYVGGRAVFHQGTEIAGVDTKVQYFGVELGKTLFELVLVKIMATGVVGSAEISADPPGADTQRERKLFISPGLTGSLPFGGFSVGLDVRYLYTKDFDGMAVYAAVGFGI